MSKSIRPGKQVNEKEEVRGMASKYFRDKHGVLREIWPFDIKDDHIIAYPWDGGRVDCGIIYKGHNDEYYVISRNQEAMAYPVGSLDNIHGTGHYTREHAARSTVFEMMQYE